MNVLALLLLTVASPFVLGEESDEPSSQPKPSAQPVYKPPEVPPMYMPTYPYFDMYPQEGFYPQPLQPQTKQEPSAGGGYMTGLIPASQSALQFSLRLLAKFGLFLMGSTALLLVGGIFTTAVCSMTPICEITFPGLTGINQAAARAMMSPEKIASAAAMVQDAIGKYQKLQKAATR